MNYTHLIAALLSATLAFGGAWQVQNWRYGAKEKQRAEQLTKDALESGKVAVRRADNVIDAQNQATQRLVLLRHDADIARSELDGMREQSAESLRAASASHSACLERATTATKLLNSCAGEYQSLGERADRHVNDIKTLTESWPK